jgi:hypothetical protein
LRTKLSQIYALDPLTIARTKLATQRLLSWVNSLDVGSSLVACESGGQVGQAVSLQDPPTWRPTLARGDTGSPFSQGDRSPISLLSVNHPAPESSICDPDRHRERTEELADSSVTSSHDHEHEKATVGAEHALKGQDATGTLIGSSSNLQHEALPTFERPTRLL